MTHDFVDTSMGVKNRRLNSTQQVTVHQQEPSKATEGSFNGDGNGILTNCSNGKIITESKDTNNIVNLNNNNNYNSGNTKLSNESNGNNIRASSNDKIEFTPKIRWPDLIVHIFLHVGAIYGLIFLFYSIKFFTFLWCKY